MTIYLEAAYVPVSCGLDGCHQTFAMSKPFYDETIRTGGSWYCPSGHSRVWKRGKTDATKLEEAQVREVHLRDQLEATAKEAEKIRAALLRDRMRFANGVCPCCNRSFENVRRHMTTKHPDYDVTRIGHVSTVTFKCSCRREFDTLRGLKIHQARQRTEKWYEPGRTWGAHLTKV